MSTYYAESFGKYLKQIREEVYGDSIRAFGRRIGFSPGYIGKLELAQVGVPKRQTIEQMAEKLGLDPDLLLTKAGYAPVSPYDTTRTEFMAMKIDRLQPEVAEVVISILNTSLDILVAKYPKSSEA